MPDGDKVEVTLKVKVHKCTCGMDCAVQDLKFEKKLSAFREERWMVAEGRLVTIWNQGIEATREKVGRHTPYCDDLRCWLCYMHKELGKLLNLDRAGYVPIRERLNEKAEKLLAVETEGEPSKDYIAGVRDMLDQADDLFGENE